MEKDEEGVLQKGDLPWWSPLGLCFVARFDVELPTWITSFRPLHCSTAPLPTLEVAMVPHSTYITPKTLGSHRLSAGNSVTRASTTIMPR